jgi:hypothetical protein
VTQSTEEANAERQRLLDDARYGQERYRTGSDEPTGLGLHQLDRTGSGATSWWPYDRARHARRLRRRRSRRRNRSRR